MTFFLIGLGVGAVAALLAFSPKFSIAAFVVGLLAGSAISYFMLPTLAWGFWGLVWFLVLGAAIGVVFSLANERRDEAVTGVLAGIGVAVAVLALIVVPLLTSAPLFHADSYRAAIGDVKESTYSTDQAPIDPTRVRVIDEETAARIASTALGDSAGLTSTMKLGNMTLQHVKDGQYWVAPLEYEGCTQYWNADKGTPGYVMVNASDGSDHRFVREYKGQPLNLLYNGGACNSANPDRYLYNHGYAGVAFRDRTFEIDDEGRPTWTYTRYHRVTGFGGEVADGVIVLDLQTGQIEEYSKDKAPVWIDRVQPEEFTVAQLNDWGDYVHGFTWFSKKDKLKVSGDPSLVYGADGKCYTYAGLTSVASDQSTIGFVLRDSRTGETKLYRLPGGTEELAAKSAEGRYKAERYRAAGPIVYNVDGLPTYFMAMKDSATGLVKAASFVSVRDVQIVGKGDDPLSALRDYKSRIAQSASGLTTERSAAFTEVRGKVCRMGVETRGGETYYYLLLCGKESAPFVAGAGLSPKLALAQVGDSVLIAYENSSQTPADVSRFDDLALPFRASGDQKAVNAEHAAVRDSVHVQQAGTNADAAWEKMTPEQKAKLVGGAAGATK